ncbi:undecaprenyl-diphosphatase [Amycolatopsis marina]|uniref:Undecaprenyl-diphosphatase n=1 Tax=Amycolatopsis marina TaxID=490629 RepID=A0A1I1AF07_9PSEU|nr:phosphatase PAP2 family protein [Amycolatopsis marina]SFB36062.1 undecaprenyl-diphosphatase [Amycolatopsis marina]
MNRRPATLALVGVCLLVAFVALGLLVRQRPPALDAAIASGLHGQWRSPLGPAAGLLSDAFGPVLPAVLAVVLVLAALWRRAAGDGERASLLLRVTAVLVLCRATSFVFKPLFARDRPREYPDLSYPSGHVVSVASVGFALVLLCGWLVPHVLRTVIALAVLATLISAAFRVYLGVHWLTDTVGAVLVVTGVGLLVSACLGLLSAKRDPVSARRGTA